MQDAVSSPFAPDFYYNLVLVETGRRGEALEMYGQFIELAPPDRTREVGEGKARFGWR